MVGLDLDLKFLSLFLRNPPNLGSRRRYLCSRQQIKRKKLKTEKSMKRVWKKGERPLIFCIILNPIQISLISKWNRCNTRNSARYLSKPMTILSCNGLREKVKERQRAKEECKWFKERRIEKRKTNKVLAIKWIRYFKKGEN